MRVDVVFGGAALTPSDVVGRVIAVIDVLRASSSIAAALANGARAVIPLDSSDEVVIRSKAFMRSDVLLAGERKSLPIPGFDLGNSPSEFKQSIVEGKTVLMTTTNGTPAILNTQGARDVVIASYVNFTAVLTMLRTAGRGAHGGERRALRGRREGHGQGRGCRRSEGRWGGCGRMRAGLRGCGGERWAGGECTSLLGARGGPARRTHAAQFRGTRPQCARRGAAGGSSKELEIRCPHSPA